jgi:peptidyl-prolyl cis-trans isomerase C
MVKATSRHILVETEKECEDLIAQIKNGEDFGDLAQKYSKCPSRAKGGDLGEFGPGQMVPEFDKVVFNEEVGFPHGQVKTEFGYHIVEITNRS